MAEPSLLCVSCARPPPPHRRTWGRCTVCVARNLPSTYYCGEECMNAHWPKHQQYHKEQKQKAKELSEGTVLEDDRSAVEAAARYAEWTGNEYEKRYAAAVALIAEGDHNAAAKAWRKIIKERPARPEPYRNLALVLQRSSRKAEAAQMVLKAMELCESGTKQWADSAACAFDLLKSPDCCEVPKPQWWNDEALKALSARVVALAPDQHQPRAMRACVLSGDAVFCDGHWNAGPRTAMEIKEAATWYRRAAMIALTPADKLGFERAARQCDEVADPLLAEEEAEASKARAAAAAEELLAEEEEEKQQANTNAGKAKQSKGKKGKGKR